MNNSQTIQHGDGDQVYAEWNEGGPGNAYATFDSAEQLTEFLSGQTVPADAVVHTGDRAYAMTRATERIAAFRAAQAAEHAAREETANTPAVGQGATMCYPQDSYGYVVVRVSPNGARVHLAMLRTPDMNTGHRPSGDCNGFPVWDHTYTGEELTTMRYSEDATVIAHRRRNGRYFANSARVVFGSARYYRNWAD